MSPPEEKRRCQCFLRSALHGTQVSGLSQAAGLEIPRRGKYLRGATSIDLRLTSWCLLKLPGYVLAFVTGFGSTAYSDMTIVLSDALSDFQNF